jgi:hypothetical protein
VINRSNQWQQGEGEGASARLSGVAAELRSTRRSLARLTQSSIRLFPENAPAFSPLAPAGLRPPIIPSSSYAGIIPYRRYSCQ